MDVPDYSHLVEIDEDKRVVRIERVFSDGRKQLFTEAPFPARDAVHAGSGYQKFCQMLGENIILDSPAARRVLGP
jgi:hypothetical protein